MRLTGFSDVGLRILIRLAAEDGRQRISTRQIAEDMSLDLGTQELADKHKVTPGRISQMRREFHDDYQRFHGESC